MFTTVNKSPLTLIIDHIVALHLSFVDGSDKLDKVDHTNLDNFKIMICPMFILSTGNPNMSTTHVCMGQKKD